MHMPQNSQNWYQNEGVCELNNNSTIFIAFEWSVSRNSTKKQPAEINQICEHSQTAKYASKY